MAAATMLQWYLWPLDVEGCRHHNQFSNPLPSVPCAHTVSTGAHIGKLTPLTYGRFKTTTNHG